jgi:hypothetical protein
MEAKLTCVKCHEVYDLCKNAGIATDEGIMSGYTTVIGWSKSNRGPDYIAHGDRLRGIPSEVKLSFSSYEERLWTCAKCKTVQEYPNSFKQACRDNPKFGIPEEPKPDGCFIATATYGDYNHPTVVVFRNYRDNELNKTIIGRYLIIIYYKSSPHIAKLLRSSNILKLFSKLILDKLSHLILNSRIQKTKH